MILYKAVFAIVIFFILFDLSLRDSSASSIDIQNESLITITNPSQEYSVDVKLSINADDGTVYYLRGVFYKDSSTNYCGYTWNGSEWFSGPYSSNEGWKKFLKITISSGSGKIRVRSKIDLSDSGCKDNGQYQFKVQRFTDKSSSGSFDEQEPKDIFVTIVEPTLTVKPTLVIVPTKAPTKAPPQRSAPTLTLTPKQIEKLQISSTAFGISRVTYSPTLSLSQTVNSVSPRLTENDFISSKADILAEMDQNEPTSVSRNMIAGNNSKSRSLFYILFTLGSMTLFLAVLVSIKEARRMKK